MGIYDNIYLPMKDENRKLKIENKKLKAKLLLSESQNYCKICGYTLDGYVPSKEKNENKTNKL